jgi:cation diffusion facilitator family transporter
LAEGSRFVVIAALLGNAAIAVTKYIAAAFTGSGAMLAEAVHSTVDTGNQFLLLVGLSRAARPPDPRHQFGYGMELYFWAFVVAILLFSLGAGVAIYEGILKLITPHPIRDAGWNYAVLGAAMVFEALTFAAAWREFSRVRGKAPVLRALRQSKDPALFTVIFEDSAALAGLAIAFVGVFLSDRMGLLRADGAATLAIGLMLALAALFLAVETKSLLIGEAASPRLVEDVIAVALRASFVDSVNEVRTMHFGPADILVNLSVDARDRLTAGEVERGVAALEDELKARHPEIGRVFIEIQAAAASAQELAPGDAGGLSV